MTDPNTSQNSQADDKLSIGKASEYLGVSVDTLRRWEKKGKVITSRSPGGHRYFLKSDLDKVFGHKYQRMSKSTEKEIETEKDPEPKPEPTIKPSAPSRPVTIPEPVTPQPDPRFVEPQGSEKVPEPVAQEPVITESPIPEEQLTPNPITEPESPKIITEPVEKAPIAVEPKVVIEKKNGKLHKIASFLLIVFITVNAVLLGIYIYLSRFS